MAVTIKDVARRAGVSVGTVSNVINGNKNVKEDKRALVEKAIKELNFRPNQKARGLKLRGSNCIGVILSDISDRTNAQILESLQKNIKKHGYEMMLDFSDDIEENEKKALKMMVDKGVAGIIITTCQPSNTDLFNDILKAVPMAFLQREVRGGECNYIRFNNYDLVYKATQYLIEKNYYSIAIFTGREDYSCEKDCIDGYLACLKNNGFNVDHNFIVSNNLDENDAYKSAVNLIRNQAMPASFIASSERVAEGILQAINDTKVNVGRQFQIVSLSGQHREECLVEGDILKLSRPAYELGKKAVETLLDNINSQFIYDRKQIEVGEDYRIEKHLVKEYTRRELPAVKFFKDRVNVLVYSSPVAYAVDSLKMDFYISNNIDINLQILDYDSLYREVMSCKSQRGAEGADVLMIDTKWVSHLVREGIILDISEKVAKNQINLKDYFADSIKACEEAKDRLYSIPIMYGEQMLLYRKDIFEDEDLRQSFAKLYNAELRPPTNWLEFNIIAKYFTKEYNPDSPVEFGTSLAGGLNNTVVSEIMPRIWAYGGDCLDNNLNVILDKGEVSRALKNYLECYRYATPSSRSNGYEQQLLEFINGQVAAVVCFSSVAVDLANKTKSKMLRRTGFAAIPGNISSFGDWGLAINASSSRKEAAFEFLKWACSPKIAAKMRNFDVSVPQPLAGKGREISGGYPWNKLFKEGSKATRRATNLKSESGTVLNYYEFQDIIAAMVLNARDEGTDIGIAIERAAEALENLVKKSS